VYDWLHSHSSWYHIILHYTQHSLFYQPLLFQNSLIPYDFSTSIQDPEILPQLAVKFFKTPLSIFVQFKAIIIFSVLILCRTFTQSSISFPAVPLNIQISVTAYIVHSGVNWLTFMHHIKYRFCKLLIYVLQKLGTSKFQVLNYS
jgi:hypothetical protein